MPPSLLQTSQPTSQTIVTSDFTVRANGLEEQLPDNDRIGQTLADVQQAAGFEEDVARDLAAHLLAILEPYADDTDISRKGEIDGTRVDGDLRAFIEQASEDPTVPRRVIEAAQLALDEGFRRLAAGGAASWTRLGRRNRNSRHQPNRRWRERRAVRSDRPRLPQRRNQPDRRRCHWNRRPAQQRPNWRIGG